MKSTLHSTGFFRHKPNAYALKRTDLPALCGKASLCITLSGRDNPSEVAPQQSFGPLLPAHESTILFSNRMTSYFRTETAGVKLFQDSFFTCKTISGLAHCPVKLFQDYDSGCKAISGLDSYPVKLFQDSQFGCKAILGLTYLPVKFFQDVTHRSNT